MTRVDQFILAEAETKIAFGPRTILRKFVRAEIWEDGQDHIMRVFHDVYWRGHPLVEYPVK